MKNAWHDIKFPKRLVPVGPDFKPDYPPDAPGGTAGTKPMRDPDTGRIWWVALDYPE